MKANETEATVPAPAEAVASGVPGHTPGPWVVDDGGSDVWGVFAEADSGAVCYLAEPAPGASWVPLRPSEADANARLIAAAPALYDAACFAHTYFSGPSAETAGSDTEVSAYLRERALRGLIAAVLKADGREEELAALLALPMEESHLTAARAEDASDA